jgi:hypothetical protein
MQVTLTTHDLFQPPITIGVGQGQELKTVVVRDGYGNPIFVAIQQTPDTIWAVTADDPKFNTVLAGLGINVRSDVIVQAGSGLQGGGT